MPDDLPIPVPRKAPRQPAPIWMWILFGADTWVLLLGLLMLAGLLASRWYHTLLDRGGFGIFFASVVATVVLGIYFLHQFLGQF